MRASPPAALRWLTLSLAGLVAAAGLTLLAGPPPAQGAGKVKLTMFIWAGANQGVVPREVVARYLQGHPDVEIEFWESTNAVTYPKMLAAKQANPNAPLVNFGYFNVDLANRGDADDMWVPLDPARTPALTKLPAPLRRPGNRGIGFSMSHVGLMYNKNLVKDPPTSWTALWDPKWRGKVTFFDNNFVPLVLAARMNGGNEQNVEAGFKVWTEQARNIRALPTTNDALKNIVVTGEAQIAPWFGGIWKFWAEEGAPLGFVNPKEGAVGFPLYLQVVKGSTPEQIKVAEEIINELMAAENNSRDALLTNKIPAFPVPGLAQKMDPAFDPKVIETAIWLDWGVMGQKASEWRQRWEKEVKSKM
jgi:putative spermidine/putrescine transport system substrate-binding protein